MHLTNPKFEGVCWARADLTGLFTFSRHYAAVQKKKKAGVFQFIVFLDEALFTWLTYIGNHLFLNLVYVT